VKVAVLFHSYFRGLTGCERAEEVLPPGGTVGLLRQRMEERFPKLRAMERSTLVAVGVEYQPPDFALSEGDEVSFFPPVQGG